MAEEKQDVIESQELTNDELPYYSWRGVKELRSKIKDLSIPSNKDESITVLTSALEKLNNTVLKSEETFYNKFGDLNTIRERLNKWNNEYISWMIDDGNIKAINEQIVNI